MKTHLRLIYAIAVLASFPAASAQEIPKPTAEHRALAKEAGTWDAEGRVWMQGPGAEPETSTGVEEITVLPGGLWTTSKFDGKMGDLPFTGRSISGYDPVKKKFVDVWVDSTDPHMLILEGDIDPASKILTHHGKTTDPRSGKSYDVKTVTDVKQDDRREFTFYIKNDDTVGDYVKILEMTYKRRK